MRLLAGFCYTGSVIVSSKSLNGETHDVLVSEGSRVEWMQAESNTGREKVASDMCARASRCAPGKDIRRGQ